MCSSGKRITLLLGYYSCYADKLCSDDFLNSYSQDIDIILVLWNSDRIYLGVDETTEQVPLITATNMMFLGLKRRLN